MYLKIREGQWVDAVLNDLSWWVILVGLGLLFLDKGPAVLYVGVAMMVLGAVLGGRGFGRITGIFSAVYNGATGYLGDLLSYSRLMALMLAGSVIASVFNQLGALGGGTVGGVILFIVDILYWTYPELCPEPDRLLRAHHAAAAFGVFRQVVPGWRPALPAAERTNEICGY